MLNPFERPRPEYPRPDRKRGTTEGWDWLNLNGPWEFRFDGENRGVPEQWFSPGHFGAASELSQIIVPFCWESLAAWGEGDAAGNDNYYAIHVFRNPLEVNLSNHRTAPRYEVGWYRRTIEIPDSEVWSDKRVILTVGAADFFTDCWCNGVHLGRNEGGYLPFEFDLTDALHQTSQGQRYADLVLRVEDPMENREQPVGKQWEWYTSTSGIWQTVYIEPRHPSFIQSFAITSDIENKVATFRIECAATTDDCEVLVEITPPEGASWSQTLKVQNGLAMGEIPVAPLFLWTPEHPHLYDATLRLQRGNTVLDTVGTYFGMRKIDSGPTCDADAPAALRLNGEPCFLRGALYQVYFPDGVYTPGEAQAFRNDILFAKEVGFNFLRVHIKVDDPLLLYYADTLGILLMADIPNFGEGGDTPLARSRYERLMRAAIQRDFNHPSIIAWCLFNETWGFGGQVELVKLFPTLESTPGAKQAEALQAAVSDVLSAASAIPLTTAEANAPQTPSTSDDLSTGTSDAASSVTEATQRIIERRKLDNLSAHIWVQSMWGLAKTLDPTRVIEDMSVVSWEHLDYYAHGDTDINSWHFYIDDYYRAKDHIGQVVNQTYAGSDFNYVTGWKQGNQPLINSEYGGVGALDGNRDTSWSFKFLTNELRRHSKISAYIYTELHDVEWEYNGFLRYDRTRKEFGYDPTVINAADVLPIDAPPIARYAPLQKVQIEVSSAHYSLPKRENVALRWHLTGIDALGRVHQNLARGLTPIVFKHQCVTPAHTIEFVTPDATILCTLSVEAVASDGEVLARNFIQLFVSPGYPYQRDEHPQRLILRALPGDWDVSQWSGQMGSHEEARNQDCCFGHGHGFYEWALPLHTADIGAARRIQVLCEASSRRVDTPQTDAHVYSTTLQLSLNGVRIYEATVPDHPHDARGALSFLRGGRGAHGFLARASIEGEQLRNIAARVQDGYLRLRCAVPAGSFLKGGLTIYGAECGRYPLSPTVIIDW